MKPKPKKTIRKHDEVPTDPFGEFLESQGYKVVDVNPSKDTREETMKFHQLAVEVKKWFEEKDIDVGYTDTNIGHFAIYIQEKLSLTREEGKKMKGSSWREGYDTGLREGRTEERERYKEIFKHSLYGIKQSFLARCAHEDTQLDKILRDETIYHIEHIIKALDTQ